MGGNQSKKKQYIPLFEMCHHFLKKLEIDLVRTLFYRLVEMTFLLYHLFHVYFPFKTSASLNRQTVTAS